MNGPLAKCGCGKHYVNPGKSTTWRGKVWSLQCFVKEIMAENVQLRSEGYKTQRKLLVFRKTAEDSPCPICGQSLGRNYQISDGKLYHNECLHEIGGG